MDPDYGEHDRYGVTVSGVQYNSPCLVGWSAAANGHLVQTNNSQIGDPPSTGPVVTFQNVHDGDTVNRGSSITVSSTGSSPARVFFFVDGLPLAFLDAAPFVFQLPTDVVSGTHSISVRAVDSYANVSQMSVVNVTVPQ